MLRASGLKIHHATAGNLAGVQRCRCCTQGNLAGARRSLKNYESSAIGESSCPVCNACVPSARWPARRKGRAKRNWRAKRKVRAKRKMAGKTQGAGSQQNAWGGKSAKQREHKTENNRCGKMLGPQSAAREHKKDCPMRQDIV